MHILDIEKEEQFQSLYEFHINKYNKNKISYKMYLYPIIGSLPFLYFSSLIFISAFALGFFITAYIRGLFQIKKIEKSLEFKNHRKNLMVFLTNPQFANIIFNAFNNHIFNLSPTDQEYHYQQLPTLIEEIKKNNITFESQNYFFITLSHIIHEEKEHLKKLPHQIDSYLNDISHTVINKEPLKKSFEKYF